jgi:hypothetical protein
LISRLYAAYFRCPREYCLMAVPLASRRFAQILAFALLSSGIALCQFVYADQCPGSKSDIGAKIMGCLSSGMIPTSADGLKVGTIVLPNTASEPGLATWATPVRLGPGVNLLGQGLLASYFECTVTTDDCLQYNASESKGAYTHVGNPTSVWQGFTLTGYVPPTMGHSVPGFTPILAQNLFDFKDAEGLTVRDVAADGANGACFLFQNVHYWTERNLFENVSSLYNCKTGFRFVVQPTGLESFGYNRFLDIRLNPYGGETGISIENNANIYNATFRMTVNKDGTVFNADGTIKQIIAGSKVIHMQDTAQFKGNELHLYVEENGSGGNLLDITSASNVFTYYGEVNAFPYTDQNNNIAARATVARLNDSGDFGPGKKFTNGVNVDTAKWSSGAAPPTGTCVNGSLYSNTSGTTGSTLYVCVRATWTDLK